jgi:hypothetical protein
VIVAVAGLPAAHFNRIQQLAPTIFGSKPVFLATPLRPEADGNYCPDSAHALKLVDVLTKRIKAEPAILKHGCGLIVLHGEGFDPNPCASAFAPFALIRALPFPGPIATSGRKGQMSVNAIAEALRAAFPPLARAVGAMTIELETRLNRTPLLLPIKNFDATVVRARIDDLVRALPLSDDPHGEIAAACKVIETRYPFAKIGGSPRRCFKNDRRIQFRLPAKAHHGMAASTDPPHNPRCYLNGVLRLGGCYQSGFHYDCIRDFSEGRRELPLKRHFTDCHGARDYYVGEPHVNIAPNDFPRV